LDLLRPLPLAALLLLLLLPLMLQKKPRRGSDLVTPCGAHVAPHGLLCDLLYGLLQLLLGFAHCLLGGALYEQVQLALAVWRVACMAKNGQKEAGVGVKVCASM
jgi:hypothetical protein